MIRTLTIGQQIYVVTVTENRGYGCMAYEDATYQPGAAIGMGDTIEAAVADWVERFTNKQERVAA